MYRIDFHWTWGDAMARHSGYKLILALSVLMVSVLSVLSCTGINSVGSRETAQRMLSGVDLQAPMEMLTVLEPQSGAVYPIDLAAPLFEWAGPAVGRWLVRVAAAEQNRSVLLSGFSNPWVPSQADWEAIKALSPGFPLRLTVFQLVDRRAVARGSVHFTVSPVPMACRVVYQELPVPFRYAEKHVDLFRWRAMSPDSYATPDTVLTQVPYCANCHTFSRDGSVFGLDMDYRGDRGGYLLADVSEKMDLKRDHVFSWNGYLRGEGGISRGLFAKISPTGDYVVATVKERPFLVRIDDPAYSQLFFPLTGHLVYYSRKTGEIHALPGADDPDVVQTSPAWSPDGRTITFARARASHSLWVALGPNKLLDAEPGEDIHTLNKKYRMHFDLWQVPFNDGLGGRARPLTGGGMNGKSNYFPRYTPDGRWIVFCQSDTGLVSQPGSRLMIVPAQGGTPRPMVCNRTELNSWHSFSPNGRWMVFSSKPYGSPHTRVYLTHVDDSGLDTPAIFLHRIGTPAFAAILPEAVGLPARGFKQVRLVEP
jgi:WD40-like Beta Propeller Repeat